MKFNRFFKLSLGAIFALPATLFIGNGLIASHLSEKIQYELQNENLLACGGGGGNSPAAKKAKAARKAKVKLTVKKKKLAEAAAAGLPTADLQAEIEALEALIEKN